MRALRSLIESHGYVFAVVCIAISTELFLLGRAYFAKGQWALLYLLIIGLIAGLSGVRPALLAAFIAFFTWNYFFLPPFHTFTVADPKDWLSLFAFLFVGIAVGLQTGHMKEREAEALAREREMALLNEFSAHLVSESTVREMADLLIREVKRATGASCVALLLPDTSGSLCEVRAGSDTCPLPAGVLETAEAALRESRAMGIPPPGGRPARISSGATGHNDVYIPLQTASAREGVLYVSGRGDNRAYSAREAQLLVAVANQSAAFLERKRLQGVAVQADALQEADKLKSTLISSVSHELKTPLSSVTATVSNLLQQDVPWDADRAREELQAVQDDLQRLSSSIGGLLDLSRLESAAWEPRRELFEFGEILGTAILRIPQKLRWRVSFDLPDDLPVLYVDFQQWTRVLENLLENALSYSPPESPVRVSASYTDDEICIRVADSGPGIAPEDRDRVFDKFYRGRGSERVHSGTGLGLSVTREIVRFHGGRIWVEDVEPHGARMVIALPRENEPR